MTNRLVRAVKARMETAADKSLKDLEKEVERLRKKAEKEEQAYNVKTRKVLIGADRKRIWGAHDKLKSKLVSLLIKQGSPSTSPNKKLEKWVDKLRGETSAVETAADAWWDSLNKKQQDAYIKLHPNSKYAKKAKSSKPASSPKAPAKKAAAPKPAKSRAEMEAELKRLDAEHRKLMDANEAYNEKHQLRTRAVTPEYKKLQWEGHKQFGIPMKKLATQREKLRRALYLMDKKEKKA